MEVRARIGSARLLLASLEWGSPGHGAASKTQSAALIQTVSQVSLSGDERAALQALAADVRWAPSDLDAVMLSFSATPHQRNQMQHYESLPEYFTRAEWDMMTNAEATIAIRQEVIINKAVLLGLRCPSEPCLKLLNSLAMVLSESEDSKALLMSAAHRQDLLKHFKLQVKAAVRRTSSPPPVYLSRLPALPAQLREGHPALFAAAFVGDETAIRCVIDLKRVYAVDVGYRCRGDMSQSASAPPTSGGIPGHSLVQFATGMMGGVFQLQQQQQQLINMMSGQQPAGGRPLQSLAALSGNGQLRMTYPNKAPNSYLALPAPPAVLPLPAAASVPVAPAAEEPAGSSGNPAASVVSVVPDAPLASSPPAVDAVSALAATGGAASSEAPTLDKPRHIQLLDALEQREADKKNAKKAEKDASKAQELEQPRPSIKKRPASALQSQPQQPLQQKSSDKGASQKKPSAKPTYSVERSRKQVMCRTGLSGPGSTHGIRFGPHEKHKTEAAAIEAARKWLKQYS